MKPIHIGTFCTSLLLLAGCCNPPLVSTVNVPTLPQQASNWCWAASGQMTMRYLGHDVAQCTEANNRFGLTSCCQSNGGSCNNGGWPEYEKYGFTASQTSDAALTFAQVQGQVHAQSVHRVGELAERNPSETASIIRQWLAEPAT